MLEQFRVVATPSRRNPTVNTYRYSPYEKRNHVPMTITAPKDNKEQSLCSQDNIDDQIAAALREAVADAQAHQRKDQGSLCKETKNLSLIHI